MTELPHTPAELKAVEITFGDIGQMFWRKLREMRTVFQLLVVIAIAALVCTVVPQNQEAPYYYDRYGRFLANLVVRLGLDHVHTTVWFLGLLGVLLLSLGACSGRLWQQAATCWAMPLADRLRTAGCKPAVNATASVAPEEAVRAAQALARRSGYHTRLETGEQQTAVLYLWKYRLSAWGQALAHYAVFLIALGSVLGALPLLSLDKNVDIAEGKAYQGEDLPFAIHVDRFWIEHNKAQGSVDNYYTQARLMSGDKELTRATISVNHPLKYRGYFISQSSWGLGEAQLEVTRNGKTEKIAFPLARGGCPDMGAESIWGVPQDDAAAYVADGKAALVATAFHADAKREQGEVVGTGSEYPGQPALSLMLISGMPGHKPAAVAEGKAPHGMQEVGWLFPGETRKLSIGEVKFVGITTSTGLGLRKDAGLPLVWIGFIASMVGLVMIFYFPLQRYVISVQAAGRARCAVGMSAFGGGKAARVADSALWTQLLTKLDGKQTSATADAEQEAS